MVEANGAGSRSALCLHKPALALGYALHTEDALQAVLALALSGFALRAKPGKFLSNT